MQTAEHRVFTCGDYLKWEAGQQDKYEYIKGEVFAMGSVRREHVLVIGNIYASIKYQLKGKPCIAYVADMKLRVEHADAFFYPDVVAQISDFAAAHPTCLFVSQ